MKHALVALGSLHELYYRKDIFGKVDCCGEPAYVLALQQYNKAIESLNHSLIDDGSNQQHVVLFTCVLFLCFEVLRGNESAALVHLENGLNILQRSLGSTVPGAVYTASLARSTTDEALWRMFTRMDLQASSYMGLRISTFVMSPKPRPFFGNISEARSDLDNILGAVYSFNRDFARGYRYGSPAAIPSSVTLERQTLLSHLATWLQNLNVLLSNGAANLPFKDICGAIVLKLEHQIAHIGLNTCLLPQEGFPYNAFHAAFEQVVSLAECLQTTTPSYPAKQSPFTFEVGVIPPLFMVASKCRDPVIRRRATAILRKAGREGVWSGPIAAVVADKIMEIEEAKMVDGKIPETALVHRTTIDPNLEKREVQVECYRARNAEFTEWETMRDIIRW